MIMMMMIQLLLLKMSLQKATSLYIDDIFSNESVSPAAPT